MNKFKKMYIHCHFMVVVHEKQNVTNFFEDVFEKQKSKWPRQEIMFEKSVFVVVVVVPVSHARTPANPPPAVPPPSPPSFLILPSPATCLFHFHDYWTRNLLK